MITILMTTLNGEKYIAEQIESLLNQTETRWKLVIQDDCSNDKTAEIIQDYVRRYSSKIIFVERESPSGSAKNNFSSMLKFAKTDYMMTCDQDDVWLPQKIEVTLQKILELEETFSKKIPLLVHTDLKVVDSNLKIVAESMFKRQNLNYCRDGLNNLLVQNIVTGCTLMVNATLLNRIQEIPQESIMHDWWFALIAATFGHIGFVNQSTILYRQHSKNEVGSKNARSLLYNIKRMINTQQSKSVLKDTYKQAKSFSEIYKSQFITPLLHIVYIYSCIPQCKKIKRLVTIYKYNFWKTGFFRRCGQILFM